MLSQKLLLELKQILLTKFNMNLCDQEIKSLGEFLITYFGLLTGLNDE